MTVNTQTPDVTQPTSTLPMTEVEQQFKWRNCWYPVAFVQDLPSSRPYSFSLYDEPLVLFRNQDEELVCLSDRCPHRAARLSDGQLIDGKIECLYHGWQFGNEGQCLHIPQLPRDAKIPANACVQSFKVVERQGIIWMWAGEVETADDQRIPIIDALDNSEVVSTDYMGDLPYDQTYLVENILDPTHVLISHDRTEFGVYREDAQPLKIEVIENSVAGIRSRYRGTSKPNEPWKHLDFIAPNLGHYKLRFGEVSSPAGLAIYSSPLGQGRCRIFIRRYGNLFNRQIKQVRWIEHLRQSKVLEEDLPQIVGQQAEIERLGQSLKQLYLPLKTSDLLVIEYRKWLDKFGQSLPFYQGYSTVKRADNKGECNQKPMLLDRLSRHTQICSSCNRAYQVTNHLKQTLVGVAIGMAALGIVTDGFWHQIGAVSVSLMAVTLAVVAEKVKIKFERSYTRH